MRTVIAVDKAGNDEVGSDYMRGNWPSCIRWAQQRSDDTGTPYVIITARPGERYAPMVAEVTRDGVRPLPGGRYLRTKRARQLYG